MKNTLHLFPLASPNPMVFIIDKNGIHIRDSGG